MKSNGYTRLPGGLRGFLRRNSTWAGSDHVLLISGTRFHERYHRVYYRDILAVITERAHRFTAPWYVFVGVPLLFLAGLGAINIRNSDKVRNLLGPALLVLAVLALLLPVVLAFFAGCRVWISTAVGNVAVPGIARVWQARRFVKAIESRVLAIEAVQP